MSEPNLHVVVDAGNTRVKLAQYQNQSCVSLEIFDEQDALENFLKSLNPKAPCILSNTGTWKLEAFRKHFHFTLDLNPSTDLPYKMGYATPASLGNDRRALAAAAVHEFPGEHCLVLDLGTCLTADFIDSSGVYHGGAISPGLRMRFRSLKHFTAALPEEEWSGINWPKLVGDSTENSILSGVVRGYQAEISSWITQYEESFGAIRTVITGGDAPLLLRWMKNDIFAPRNFLLNGLDYILEYHLNQK